MTKSRQSADFAAGGPSVAGKNFIINGGFDVWQRGTSFASVSGYFADRWTNSATYSNITSSRQSTGAPLGTQYYARHTSTASGSYISTYSYLESATVVPLLGKTVTFTLKLRRNSTMTANINVRLSKSSTVDAGSGATWTDISSNTVTNASMPTTTGSEDWYTSTITALVPNDGTANSLRISTDYSATVASGSTLDIAAAQLEIGQSATPFSRAGGTIQGELAACQRYYEIGRVGMVPSNVTGGDQIGTWLNFAVAKRTSPTLTITIDFQAGFTSTTTAGDQTTNGLIAKCTKNGSTGGGYWFSNFTASAEL